MMNFLICLIVVCHFTLLILMWIIAYSPFKPKPKCEHDLHNLCREPGLWSIYECSKCKKCYEITLLGMREIEKESWMK